MYPTRTHPSRWSMSPGSKVGLTGYKILGQVSAEAPVCFAVQLSLNNPPEERRERYVVVGIDPLWVWRYDEYVMITHWCQPMSGSQSPPLKP